MKKYLLPIILSTGCSHSETITVKAVMPSSGEATENPLADTAETPPETATDTAENTEDTIEDTEETTEPPPDSGTENTSICGDRPIGTAVGMCAEDFNLPNAENQTVSLYDFAGDVIFLDMSGFT